MQFDRLGRRELFSLLGGAAAAWPRRAQQPSKLPTIGFMGASTPSAWSQFVVTFEQQLHDLGWIAGRTTPIRLA
jgi:hypothetical protein